MVGAVFAVADGVAAGTADNQSTVTFTPLISADLEADTTVGCAADGWLAMVSAGSNRV